MSKEFNIPVESRKYQENISNLLATEVVKTMVKFDRSVYDAYLLKGFSPEQAFTLLLKMKEK